MSTQDKAIGRPPLEDSTVDDVKARLERGDTPAKIVEETGVSQTKVYEIRRLLEATKARSA
jgi:hypothetical protein